MGIHCLSLVGWRYNEIMDIKGRLIRFRSFWIFPLLSILLLLISYPRSHHTVLDLTPFAAGGLVIWTLLEYFFHRFLLHAEFQNAKLREFVNKDHLQHHAAPRDRDRILVKTGFALVTSSLIFALLYVVMRDAVQTTVTMMGIWLGFLYYEAVHYRVHISLAHSPLLQRQRRAHFYHHFSNSEKCFGVTSPLWD